MMVSYFGMPFDRWMWFLFLLSFGDIPTLPRYMIRPNVEPVWFRLASTRRWPQKNTHGHTHLSGRSEALTLRFGLESH